ncbi:RdRP-domain-containing protein, partial [Peniophora sp. CONT]
DRLAPYASLAVRLVLTSSKQLQKFRRLAGVAQLHSVHAFQVPLERRALFSFTALAELRVWMRHFPWRVSFQIEATLNNLLVDATELLHLIPRIGSISASHGSKKTASFLKLFRERVGGWWDRNDVTPSQKNLETCFERALADFELQAQLPDPDSTIDEDVFYSHKVILTATGMLLEGPFPEQSNRVLRAYPREHHDCFLRVSFMDDGSVPYRFDRQVDSRGFVRFRVGKALKDGLEVAGKRFRFLAYSLSALKEHTVWFVRPFVCSDRHGETIRVDAPRIIASLGTFDGKTRSCPARYAARISQVFTATDRAAVVEVEEVFYGKDIKTSDQRYCFTDGVGTLSLEMAERLWAGMQERKRTKRRIDTPRAFQVRFQGSKGMLSVDHKLPGAVIVLRPSMKKFDAPDEPYVEIARAFDKPNAYFLNRPLIMVLEGLGVPYSTFKKYQDAAVSEVKGSTREIASTAKLFDKYGLGTSFRVSSVLNSLAKLGVNHVVDDKFFDKSLVFAVNHILRDLKNHARIPVPQGYTLVGVADVHGGLWGNEVYACVQEKDGSLRYLEGDVLISRSPTCHPGDVQIATAIGRPPAHSSFSKEPLPNMIVFAARGRRPLPSCLGGGDLDGDLYNIIPLNECPEFRPRMTSDAAAYDAAPWKVLDRPSTMADVADFVVDYINSDVLGLIATNWLITADQSPNHMFDPDCMVLSQLHSDAVDFQKSGQAVVIDKIPKLKFTARPDWSAPETVNVANSTTHYPSRRALGRLFRRIDLPEVDPATEEHRQRRRQGRTANLDVNDLADELGNIAVSDVDEDPVHLAVRQRVNAFIDVDEEPAKPVRDAVAQLFWYIAGELQGLCTTHVLSHRRTSTLTEEEVFVGTIIEKTSLPRKRRETMATMREHTDHLVQHIHDQLAAAKDEPLAIGLRRGWTAWQLSLAEHRLFGAKTFGWVALGSIFDTIKDIEEAEKGEMQTAMR